MTDAQTLTRDIGGVWRNGRGQAPCPVCQPERRRDQIALSIAHSGDKVLAWCFKSGCSFRDIAGAAGVDLRDVQIDHEAQAKHEAKQAEYRAAKLAKARSLWDVTRPIQGTKAEKYLRARGITCDLPETLRFMGDIYHQPTTSWCCAMIADVSSGGVHRTFFSKRGNRLKRDAKMMLGPCAGGAVRLSDGPGPLVVAEGIETGLSLLSGLLNAPATVLAALSASGLRALKLPPTPGELIVATDGDDPGRKAGDVLANRAARLGWRVSLMPAPDGKDWNDVLKERTANG